MSDRQENAFLIMKVWTCSPPVSCQWNLQHCEQPMSLLSDISTPRTSFIPLTFTWITCLLERAARSNDFVWSLWTVDMVQSSDRWRLFPHIPRMMSDTITSLVPWCNFTYSGLIQRKVPCLLPLQVWRGTRADRTLKKHIVACHNLLHSLFTH